MKKNLTNVEFVTEMMEFSRYGSLSQVFIIQAIHEFANKVDEKGDAMIKEEKESSKRLFISMEAWVGIGREIKEKIENR